MLKKLLDQHSNLKILYKSFMGIDLSNDPMALQRLRDAAENDTILKTDKAFELDWVGEDVAWRNLEIGLKETNQ